MSGYGETFEADPIVVIEGEDKPSRGRRAEVAGDNVEAARQRLAQAREQRQNDIHQAEMTALTAKSEADAAQYAYEQASELGDWKKQAEAGRAMMAAESRLQAAEQAQAYWRRAPISTGDAFEDHLNKFTPKTAGWMREHRDWVEDPRKNSKLIGAHHMAVGDGMVPDSPEYFAHVERTLKLDGRSGGNSESRGKSSRSSEINASDPRTHVNGNRVYLTENEKRIATDGTLTWNHGPKRGQPLGLEEFARRKAEMVRQPGWYDKI